MAIITLVCALLIFSPIIGGAQCTATDRQIWNQSPQQGAQFTTKLIKFGKRHGPTIMMLSSFFFAHANIELRNLEPRLSTDCAECFVRSIACGARNCAKYCISDESSRECSACCQSKCNPALSQCVGSPLLPPSPYDLTQPPRRAAEAAQLRRRTPTSSPPSGAQAAPALPPPIEPEQQQTTLTRIDSWPHLPDDYDPFYISYRVLSRIGETAPAEDTQSTALAIMPIESVQSVNKCKQVAIFIRNNLRFAYYAVKFTFLYLLYSIQEFCFTRFRPTF